MSSFIELAVIAISLFVFYVLVGMWIDYSDNKTTAKKGL